MEKHDGLLISIILLITLIVAFFIGVSLRKQVTRINNTAFNAVEVQ